MTKFVPEAILTQTLSLRHVLNACFDSMINRGEEETVASAYYYCLRREDEFTTSTSNTPNRLQAQKMQYEILVVSEHQITLSDQKWKETKTSHRHSRESPISLDHWNPKSSGEKKPQQHSNRRHLGPASERSKTIFPRRRCMIVLKHGLWKRRGEDGMGFRPRLHHHRAIWKTCRGSRLRDLWIRWTTTAEEKGE